MADSKKVGLKAKQIRLSQGKRLTMVAVEAGFSNNKLHRIEEGQNRVTVEDLEALAKTLNVTTAQLLED